MNPCTHTLRARTLLAAAAAATLSVPASPCPPDVTLDGVVDVADLVLVITGWGSGNPAIDVNGNGIVDVGDLVAVITGWGPCPAPGLVCVESLTYALDDDGTFTMRDWTEPGNALVPFTLDESQYQPPIAIGQNPPPGASFIGPQSMVATVTVSDGAGALDQCQIEMELVDTTPPQVSISGVADGQALVVPEHALPQVYAFDAVDPAPVLEAWLDGEAYAPGTPIVDPGLHLLRVSARDTAGNVGEAPVVAFEIRQYPLEQAVAVTGAMECSQGESWAALDATIFLAASSFDVRQINLYSVNLWALNEHGLPLNREPIAIAGSADPGGGYNFQTVEAMYQHGFWVVHFLVNLEDEALIGCASDLLITGSANRGTPNEMDFEAVTGAAVDPDPIGTLQKLGLFTFDPPMLPQEEPQWAPCKWKHRFRKTFDTSFADTNSDCGVFSTYYQRTHRNLVADGAWFWGESWAVDECFGAAVNSGSVTATAHATVWLEGPKDCCDCNITCTFTPKFKGRVEINPPAEGLAAGMIDIASTCGCEARAVGGAQAGVVTPTEITFGAGASVGSDGPSAEGTIEVTMTLTGAEVNEQAFTGNAVCESSKCSVTVSMVATGRLDVKADADLLNLYAKVISKLFDASPGVEIEAICQAAAGPCAGAGLTFTYK